MTLIVSAWDGFNTLPAAEFAACKIPGTKLIIYEEGRASSSWRLIRGGSQRSSQLSRRCSVYWLKIHDLHGGIDTLGSIPRLEPLWVVTRSCWRQQGRAVSLGVHKPTAYYVVRILLWR